MQPHPALDGHSETERTYLKVLTSGILTTLLPTEDVRSHCERTLVREILSGMVLWNMIDKLSEPWMLYEIISKLLGPEPGGNNAYRSHGGSPNSTSSVIPGGGGTDDVRDETTFGSHISGKGFGDIFESCLSVLITLLSLITSFLSCLYTYALDLHDPILHPRKPIVRSCLVRFILGGFAVSGTQPWLSSALSLLIAPLTQAPAGGFVDIIILSNLHSRLGPDMLVHILSAARDAVFPNGSLGPARPTPSTDEQSQIKVQTAHTLHSRLPTIVAKQCFGEDEAKQFELINELLEVLGEKEINKHLLYRLLDHVVIKLMPKLEECGASELYRERS